MAKDKNCPKNEYKPTLPTKKPPSKNKKLSKKNSGTQYRTNNKKALVREICFLSNNKKEIISFKGKRPAHIHLKKFQGITVSYEGNIAWIIYANPRVFMQKLKFEKEDSHTIFVTEVI